MRPSTAQFRQITSELTRLMAERRQLVASAFQCLERRYPLLANELLEQTGNRQRAAQWMCAPMRASGGRMPYDLLAEGDEDGIWDLLQRPA